MDKKMQLWVGLSPLLLGLTITIAIITIVSLLPPKLPLFYSLPWGENQLATHNQFFILPALITLITLLNFIVSGQLHNSQSFFKKALLFSSIVVTFVLTITFFKIILNFI